MNVIGLIAEYNPFHNGHLYQLKCIKDEFKDSIIILILTGEFCQRGEFSILDKWNKTKIALEAGIDLVVSLPFVYSTESADIFASSSIKLLNALKIDTLAFGSETNDVDLFIKLAKTQLNDKSFNELVKKYLSEGNNYPTSISLALKDLNGIVINNPNDLLAISYAKEVLKQNDKIKLFSVKRTSKYHDLDSNEEIISASNIRNKLINNEDISSYIPKITYNYLKEFNIHNKLFDYLKYKIITEEDLSKYQTVDEGIENRLKKYILSSNTYDEFISKVKTKRYTYNKINRMLIHILVGFTKKDKLDLQSPSFIRILGMNKRGQKYLSSIKKDISLPLITKYIKGNIVLEYELKAVALYSLMFNKPELIENEYKNKIIMY